MQVTQRFTLKSSAIAVVAMLAIPSFAAVNLDTGMTSIKYASEQDVASTGTVLMPMVNGSDLTAYVSLGASFVPSTVVYVRFNMSAGTYTATPSLAVFGGGATGTVVAGGAGQAYVIYALTPNPVTGSLTSNMVMSLQAAGGLTVINKNPIQLTYRLFGSLADATSQTGSLKDAASQFVAFTPALDYVMTPTAPSPVANVSATGGAFTDFTVTGGKALGTVRVLVNNDIAMHNGAYVTSPSNILTDANTLTVTGDFSLAASDAPAGFDAAALNRVRFRSNPFCAVPPGPTLTIFASSVSASSATFTNIPAYQLGAGMTLCVYAEGTPQIQASSYLGNMDLTNQAGFTVADRSDAFSPILRNGAQVDVRSYVPSATLGYTSVVRVINNSATAAPVTGQWLYQDGTMGAAATLISSLPGHGSQSLSSAQVEAAIGVPAAVGANRPRLRLISASTGLQAQSLIVNPSGDIATLHGAD